MIPLSAVILTYNEEKNIEDCLNSLHEWVDEIFIVDSFSDDGTLQIAGRFTDKVYQNPFKTHSQQWNWALKNLPFSHEWALPLDADQRATLELRGEIERTLAASSKAIDGYYIKRRQVFRGKWIKYGGYYPKYLLKLFRHKRAWCEEAEIIEHRFYVSGQTGKLKNDIIEDNKNEYDFSFWIDKHKRYALLQAKEELSRKKNKLGWPIKPSLWGSPDQKALWMKQLYYRLPLYVRPLLYFFYRYFLRLGFLDGRQGLIFHFRQGLWYRLLVDVNIFKLKKQCLS
jgi:glycosyltransferase involved in cell wall biosynthesis